MVRRPGSKKLIIRKLPRPESTPDSDPHDAWRCGSFFIFYNREDLSSSMIDLNGKYFAGFQATEAEMLAIAQNLMTTHVGNTPVFPPDWDDLTDEEFLGEGLEALSETIGPPPEQNTSNMINDIFDAAHDTLLDQLLKPTTKKKK